jgi:flavin reductase (DIM6/NTAB) family NADH-FMN oxidoreductase RutF
MAREHRRDVAWSAMTDETGSEAFDRLVGLLDYPMFVVTTRAGDQLGGCLVGFTSQVSIRASRFLVGLSKRNHTYRVARRATHLAVHLLR